MTANENDALKFVLKHLQQTGDSIVSREASNHLDAIVQEDMAAAEDLPDPDGQTNPPEDLNDSSEEE